MQPASTWIPTLAVGALALATGAVAQQHAAADPGGATTTLFAGVLPRAADDGDFPPAPSTALFELGRSLFFDKILSGNGNIACASCHHPFAGTSDGLSLPIGEGGTGTSVARNAGLGADSVTERVPRNSPALFNLGAFEFTTMFHDGRLAVCPEQPSGFCSPAGADLPSGLASLLAAQAMFPVTSGTEMAGHAGENEIADLAGADDLPAIWAALAARLRAVPAYVEMFVAAFPDVGGAADITFVHAANAIAAFEDAAWRAIDSPFDRFLRGDASAMSLQALRGMALFYGKAGCATCHSGTFQTDHGFHAIAMPQIGPGKGDGESGLEDHGRGRVTFAFPDLYRFRTPSLRNVALTAPYGHAGAYATLEAVVRHHLNPLPSLYTYDVEQAILPGHDDLDALDFALMEACVTELTPTACVAVDDIARMNELAPKALSERQIEDLIAFLHALTDPTSVDLRADVPIDGVASGSDVFD